MKNSEKIIKALNSITDDDIERMAFQLNKKLEDEKLELITFKQSGEFDSIITKIKEELKTVEYITDNPYSEPLFKDISNEDFIKVFQYLFNKSILERELFEDNQIPFENDNLEYENLIFSMIYGKGTAFLVKLK